MYKKRERERKQRLAPGFGDVKKSSLCVRTLVRLCSKRAVSLVPQSLKVLVLFELKLDLKSKNGFSTIFEV